MLLLADTLQNSQSLIFKLNRWTVAGFLTAAVSLSASYCQGDVVTDWNEVMRATLVQDEEYQNPGMASRTQAMMNLAIYDAINGINQQNPTFYNYGFSPSNGASTEAAAATAAHGVLAGIYPHLQMTLDSALNASLEAISDANARAAGEAFGNQIASSIVARRANDGFDQEVQYMPIDEIGRWTPDPLNPNQEAWGPEWGAIRPFSLTNTAPYMPPPMPALDSPEYAASYNEVKVLGELNSTKRTQLQSDIGFFWAYDRVGMGTPMRLYNKIIETIAKDQGNTTEENAELFAKTSVAVADAGIVAWDAKFEFDLWRPVTGIREGDDDGNPGTAGDPNWTPLGAPGGGVENDFTPPFPTYISGHATFGGALFESIANFYGTDDIAFDVTSEEMPDMMRSFTKLSDAMKENGRSRVYLGIHWDYDDLEGQKVGMNIADAVHSSSFVAVPEPASGILAALLLAGLGSWRHRVR